MNVKIRIGTWIEISHDVPQYTSYAADRIDLRTVSGEYPLMLSFVTGYNIPMPYWLLVGVDAEVIGGGYVSGMAGNNFAFTPADTGPTKHHRQIYEYLIPGLIKSGKARLFPEFQEALCKHGSFMEWVKAENISWTMLHEMNKTAPATT